MNLQEVLINPPPPDQVDRIEDGLFTGVAYVYGSDSDIKEVKINFKPNRPLDPFYYNKPDTNIPPEFTKDEKSRENIYPLTIVRDSRRRPNHLYELDDAIIAGVNTGTDEEPNWETRYFPKNCIDESTWIQALEILGTKE